MVTGNVPAASPRCAGCGPAAIGGWVGCGDGARAARSLSEGVEMPAVAERLPVDVARLSQACVRGDADRADGSCQSPQARQGASATPRRAARRKRRCASRRPADLGARRERRRNACGDSPGRGSVRAPFQCARHLRHRDLGADRRGAASGRRDPSVRAARRAILHRALPRALAAEPRAVRRIRPVAEPDREREPERHSADPGERAPVGALVHALALPAVHHRRATVALRPLSRAVRG